MADIETIYDLIGQIEVVDGTPYTTVDPTVTPTSTNPVQSKGIYDFVRAQLENAVDGQARADIADLMIEVNNLDQKIEGKMEFYKIDYANNLLSHDGVVLTYAEIIAKYNDPKYFIYVEGDGYTYIPTLPPLEGDEIIEFSSTYLYGGHAYTSRVIINSLNQIKHEEIQLLRSDESPAGVVTKEYVDQQDAALQTQIDDELAEIREQTDRIDVLYKMSKGILYDFVSQTVEGTQNIPKGSHLADIQKLEGKSIVYNNEQIISSSRPIVYGITRTKLSSETIRVFGTCERTTVFTISSVVKPDSTHTFLFKVDTNGVGCGVGVSDTLFALGNMVVGKGFTSFGLYIPSDTEIDVIVRPQIFDLTRMFGTGNEPTLEECKRIFVNDFYPYSSGELQSVDNSKVTVKPSGEVIPLTFVGKSAGTVRDELDLVNKKYIQRVGVVDLGSVNWSYNITFFPNKMFYFAENLGASYSPYLQAIYESTSVRPTQADYPDNSINAFVGNKNIYVRDDSCTSVAELKAKLNGVMFYYELEEPIITDVSTVIDSFEVEGNGSIEFDSSIPVKNTIEYLRYLNEV